MNEQINEENRIVIYDNKLNSVRFKSFGAIDYDIFMSVCLKARDHGTNELEIDFAELKKLSNYRHATEDEFVADLIEMNKKLLSTTCEIKTTNEVIQFVLFPTFKTNMKKKKLTIKVNEEFAYLLNDFSPGFTMFDLAIFTKLRSKYAKTLYREFAQYRNKYGNGWWSVGIGEFKELMDIPESYDNCKIIEKIVKPALKELRSYFGEITCTTKKSEGRGHPIIGLKFEYIGIIQRDKQEAEKKDADQIPAYKRKSSEKTGNKFNNFDSREYDWGELEKFLLNTDSNAVTDAKKRRKKR